MSDHDTIERLRRRLVADEPLGPAVPTAIRARAQRRLRRRRALTTGGAALAVAAVSVVALAVRPTGSATEPVSPATPVPTQLQPQPPAPTSGSGLALPDERDLDAALDAALPGPSTRVETRLTDGFVSATRAYAGAEVSVTLSLQAVSAQQLSDLCAGLADDGTPGTRCTELIDGWVVVSETTDAVDVTMYTTGGAVTALHATGGLSARQAERLVTQEPWFTGA